MNQITSVGIDIFAKSFEIDYFANAFPYKYKTQHYQQRQVWYRNALLGRHADRCAQAEFMEDNRVVTWHCFHAWQCIVWDIISWRQTGVWRITFLTQRSLWQFLTPGLRHFFQIHHTAPLCTPWDHSCWNFANDKCNTQAIGFRTTAHVTAPSSDNT